MCVGFLGIQFAFALQNADVSRIFQTLGADLRANPDPLGGGAALRASSCSRSSATPPTTPGRASAGGGPTFSAARCSRRWRWSGCPTHPVLWMAAVMLWLMDASINISMEPFRAFVGDQLPESQRPLGFALQSFFIGVGAVLASLLPWALAKAGVANVAPAGQIPATVRIAFYVGAAVLFCAVLWTVVTTREYAPERLLSFGRRSLPAPLTDVSRAWRLGLAMLAAGGLGIVAIRRFCAGEGALPAGRRTARVRGAVRLAERDRQPRHGASGDGRPIRHAGADAPPRLGAVLLLVRAVRHVDLHHAHRDLGAVRQRDPQSAAYNTGANWVGVLFAAGNCFLIAGAVTIPLMVRLLGLRWSHLVNLAAGGLGSRFLRLGPQPRLAAALDGRGGLRLGLDPVAALHAAVGQPAGREDGRLHGHLQFLHRHPADAGGERARGTGACALRRPAGIRAGAGGREHAERAASAPCGSRSRVPRRDASPPEAGRPRRPERGRHGVRAASHPARVLRPPKPVPVCSPDAHRAHLVRQPVPQFPLSHRLPGNRRGAGGRSRWSGGCASMRPGPGAGRSLRS